MFQSISRVSFLYKLIFLVVGLAVAFGVFASPAKAQSTADLQRMIEQLLQQIAQLKAQTEIENIRGQVEGCPNLTYNLKVGDTDGTTSGEVSQLQAFLVKKYGLNRADYVTGYFGLGTRGLVSRFQSENGLMVVGIAGPQTRAKIANVCGDENKGQRLDVKVSPSDPDSYSILLTENVASESWYHIFSFRLSAEKSDSEIFVRKLPIYLSKSSTEDDVLDFVKDIRLEIDGEVYDDYTANDIDPQTARVLFNLDGDLEIEAGDYVEVEVAVKFAPLEKEEWAGVQIEARAEGPAIDAQGDEGELGDSDLYGQARGESHHFQFGNLVANMMDYEVTLIDGDKLSTADDMLKFVVDFELTAVDDDVYIPTTAGVGGQGGISASFFEVSAKDRLETGGKSDLTISSTADEDGGYFEIKEGTTEEFTYIAHFKPSKSGTYRMQLDRVRYASSMKVPDSQMLFLPEHMYSTGEKFVAGSGSSSVLCATDTLKAGQSLTSGKSIQSCNKEYSLNFGTDGNLELLYKNNKGIWISNTAGSGATSLKMQTDGNLVLYTKTGKAVWSLLSYVGGKMGTGQYLWLNDDGTLAVYDQKGNVRWSTSMSLKVPTVPTASTIDGSSLTTTDIHPRITGRATGVGKIGLSISKGGDKFDGTGQFNTDAYGNWGVTLNNQTYAPGTYGIDVYNENNVKLTSGTLVVKATEVTTTCGKLLPGKYLTPGQSLKSCNGVYTLIFPSDGNLRLGSWTSNTAGKGATKLTMQTDGNLVIYAGSKALWSVLSYVGGRMGTGQYLELKDNGTLAVYDQKGNVRWSTSMPLKEETTTTYQVPSSTTTEAVTKPAGYISSISSCTPGLGKSTTDPNNAIICDQTISWTTSNGATNVKLVITGDAPYTSTSFSSGYTAGTGTEGSGTFWVTTGTYKATLYNGTTKLDEKTFTIANPTARKNSLNQMATVLEALRAVLGGWR